MKRTAGAAIVILVFVLPRTGELRNSDAAPTAAFDRIQLAPSASSETPASYLRDPLHFLSTAPPDSLILLPGIGPVLAERIAGARTGKRSFTHWDDLMTVNGIGPKKVDRLRSLTD